MERLWAQDLCRRVCMNEKHLLNSEFHHTSRYLTMNRTTAHSFPSSACGRLRKYTAVVCKRSTLYDINPKTGVFMSAVFVPLTILKSLATIRVTFLNV